ncbi:MAG: GNAT family N-acetyltransferase, partial [Bacteroidia bacterium]|nr:GNAT family N-acetyltransferase [Bacteroidia bacterium]
PILCQYHGKKVLCAQSGDTMTHSDHRGKGLFIELAKRTYVLAKESGAAFIYGFPNQNSYPGFVNKLAWQHHESLHLHSIKVLTLPLAKLAKKITWIRTFYVLYVKLILCFYKRTGSGFPNSLSGKGNNSILHDAVFFEYKKYHDTFILKLHGKLIWAKIDGRLWIGDVELQSKQVFNKTISSLKVLAFLTGVDEIHFHTHPGTDYDTYMSEFGKIKSTIPIGFLDLESGIDVASFKFQSGDSDTF